MDIQQAFAKSLRATRKARGLTQEDFSIISSRTYLSALERGLKNPTLEKIQQISEVLKVHPLTLLVQAYIQSEENLTVEGLLERVQRELKALSSV